MHGGSADQEGATAVEYAIMVAAIAAVIVAIVVAVGGSSCEMYDGTRASLAAEISGSPGPGTCP